MKKVFWIKPIIFAVILLLIACKKEIPPGDIEWKPTHWPVVRTLYVTNLTSTSATLNGAVDGYGLCTTVTFEYGDDRVKGDNLASYSNTVTASQSPVADSGIIYVSADISGLSPCQVYHFRLKAENSLWVNFYGDQYGFSTLPDSSSQTAPLPFNPNLTYGTVSDIDGNSYNTIQIGFQVWMAENLRTTRYADGTPIPLVSTIDEWGALTTTDKAYSWYNWGNDCSQTFYGAYYTWAAAMNGAVASSSVPSGVQGVCPDGWHLPSEDEWSILAKFPNGDVGSKLKDTLTWITDELHPATNESGFTALASSSVYNFNYIGFYSYMWSTTEYTEHCCDNVITGGLSDGSNFLTIGYHEMKDGIPVRCLKDYTPHGQLPTVITDPATNSTSTAATLNGTVNANGSPTIVEFEYYAGYIAKPPNGGWRQRLTRILATQSPITGSHSTQVSVTVRLKPESIRKFRVIATNSAGVVYGDYVTYTLP